MVVCFVLISTCATRFYHAKRFRNRKGNKDETVRLPSRKYSNFRISTNVTLNGLVSENVQVVFFFSILLFILHRRLGDISVTREIHLMASEPNNVLTGTRNVPAVHISSILHWATFEFGFSMDRRKVSSSDYGSTRFSLQNKRTIAIYFRRIRISI